MEVEPRATKKQNPKEIINPILGLLFFHMIPIFKNNYKKGILEEDLFEALQEHKSNNLGEKLEVLWKKATCKHDKFALHIALCKLVGLELLLISTVKLLNDLLLVFVMPMAVGGLVSYFESSSKVTVEEAYMYAGIIISNLIVYALIDHPSRFATMHVCMKIRVSCCAVIYRKSLRLSRTALADTTVGQIVNLLSNDVSKFDQNLVLCHYLIIGPLQSALATYLLYRIIGVAAFAGIGFLLLFIPLELYLGKRISIIRLRTALRTDERVRLMNEILNGIQVIKMYTWEKPFAKLVSLARRHEIDNIRVQFFLQSIIYCLESFVTRTSIFISLILFTALGANITANVAYSITAIYNVIRTVMTIFFPLALASGAEVYTSITRIQTFLNYEEQFDATNEKSSSNYSKVISKISMTESCAKWLKYSCDNTLTKINFNIEGNKLIAIVGPVGSGKSSVFAIILGELPISNGKFQVKGKISYASQEPWLFSASIKQNILFGETYDEGRYKTVIKVCALESDLATLPYGDRTLIGEKGKAISGGQKARINLARCVYRQADIYLLDDPLSAVDTKVGKELFEKCIKQFLKNKMCLLITHQLQYLKHTDQIIILKEGHLVGEGTYDELQSSGLNFAKLLQEFHIDDKRDQKESSSVVETSEINQEDDGVILSNHQQHKETLVKGRLKAATYASYLKAGGNYCILSMVILGFVISQMSINTSDYFIFYWVNLEQTSKESNVTVNQNEIMYMYSGITVLTVVLGIGHYALFFVFFMRASVNMHDNVFKKVSHASMSFFYANPVGRILNRFSKDIGIIDNYIPFIFSEVIEITLSLLGTIILAATVNGWLILPPCGLLVTFYLLRVVYLETSRNVKRIEGITRSPMFSQVTATMNGLSTIRVFSMQNALIQEFDSHQDHHSSAWYLFISATSAFGFFLDITSVVFISFVILSVLTFNKGYYGGDVGLVVTQYLSLTGMLQWGMRQMTELENNMTSVERVLELTDVELEPTRKAGVTIPENWPKHGQVVFQNVSMKYSAANEPVLVNLNCTIYHGEKIGIVGRTGAGKTSTISALFQLFEIEGYIIIDDVDITKIPLEILRSKISVIPQDPVLFSGTMRKNLDPFHEYSDDNLWNALEQVELKEAIHEEAGLDMNVTESGSNFSIGQRQLVCLARALIRNNQILIMDEATANVDPYTDSLIQKTIRRVFSTCTVITIAHRLHTIMDSDRVLVLDAGKIIEFDHPYNLLQNKNGVFYSMVETTGQSTSDNLYSTAEQSFQNLKNC